MRAKILNVTTPLGVWVVAGAVSVRTEVVTPIPVDNLYQVVDFDPYRIGLLCYW
jgi:hypothetical protein